MVGGHLLHPLDVSSPPPNLSKYSRGDLDYRNSWPLVARKRLELSRLTLGSEQALSPVREPDTFAEGTWEQTNKSRGDVLSSNCHYNFDRVPYKISSVCSLYVRECVAKFLGFISEYLKWNEINFRWLRYIIWIIGLSHMQVILIFFGQQKLQIVIVFLFPTTYKIIL